MDTVEKTLLPAHGRSGFEVAGWDGVRWVLEGVFDTDAAPQKPERKPAAEAPSVPRYRPEPQRATGTDTVLYVAISSLVISILAMVFAIAR